MIGRSMVFLSCLAVLACDPRSAQAGSKAFDVPEAVFFDRVHNVILVPCQFPSDFSKSDTLAARLEGLRWQVDSLLVLRLQGAGAFLEPSVAYVSASFEGGVAFWNGARERIIEETFGGGFMKRLSFKTSDIEFKGNLSALSLFVAMTDGNGQFLYTWGGGLQTTKRLVNRKFLDLPVSGYLMDEAKIVKAVELALTPMEKAAHKSGRTKP